MQTSKKSTPFNGVIDTGAISSRPAWRTRYLPFLLLIAMEVAILLFAAVLPLEGLWFHNVPLTQFSPWFQLPTAILFPGWSVTPPMPYANPTFTPPIALGWQQIPFLFAALLAIFLVYLIAIHRLPSRVTYRFILLSTLLFGITFTLIPVAASPDLFSYIGYARMGIIYHLNPLTTIPTTISTDPSFPNIYWIGQPSAYGPVWAFISSFLQIITLPFGTQSLLPMVMALRLWALAMHLCSVALVWSIGGHLQRINGRISPRRRLFATLAFAWNPLLLLEAANNAHNDSSLLVLVLLALWFLARNAQNGDTSSSRGFVQATIMLALATALKVNIVLLYPALLLFLWHRQPRRIRPILISILIYGGVILLLYAPFWQNGAILAVLRDNPTSYRNINTLPEFISELYRSYTDVFKISAAKVEELTHYLTIGIFAVLYILLALRALIRPAGRMRTLPDLIRWMALIWFLYCAIGAPWFWPWYLVTFFGLYALVEAVPTRGTPFFGLPRMSSALRLLAFSMPGIYIFYTWAAHSSFIPVLNTFSVSYLRGLWAWSIPLLAFIPLLLKQKPRKDSIVLRKSPDQPTILITAGSDPAL